MGGSYSMQSSQAKNRLSMAYYVCVSTMLMPLYVSNMPCNRSFWPSQAYMLSVSLPTRACLLHNFVCLVFNHKFNIMSGLFIHQSLTLPQKIDSRGGLFWCKNEVSMWMQRNEYLFKDIAICTNFWAIYSKI